MRLRLEMFLPIVLSVFWQIRSDVGICGVERTRERDRRSAPVVVGVWMLDWLLFARGSIECVVDQKRWRKV